MARSPRHLTRNERALCLLGVAAALAVFSLARWGVPFARSNAWLRVFLMRPCLLKEAAGVPCPFCGGTRAAVLAARGEWMHALLMNPLGFLVIVGGAAAGLWLGTCALNGRDLGLSAAGRAFARIPWGWALLGGILLLWAFKIVQVCVMKGT